LEAIILNNNEREIKIVLRYQNKEFKRLEDLHQDYDKKLQSLNEYHFHTQDQKIKIVELKKLKLRTKDRMAAILRDYKDQSSQNI